MSLRFLPWLRAQRPDDGTALSLQVGATPAQVPLQRLGPGDVQRLADALPMQPDPAPQSVGFPPACLASVSFPEPAWPWLLTPTPPDAAGLLVPWITLVVLPESEAAQALATRPGGTTTLTLPADRLPAFEELSAFAHVQVQGPLPPSADVAEIARTQPGRVRSRLLAAQRLAPGERYVACLVPTFDAGRRAGLGEPVPDPNATQPAWTPGAGPVTLPVYASWRFGTTRDADIETLARRLATTPPAEMPPAPPLAIDALGVSEPTAYRGVFRSLEVPPEPAPTAASERLATLLHRAEATDLAGGSPTVGLPRLGQAHGAPAGTPWADELNFDPRLRTMAGLGAELVRRRQDALVDAFWRQAGAVQRAQRLFVGAGFAASVSARLVDKHLAPGGSEPVLLALQARAAGPGGAVLAQAPALRRMAVARRIMGRPAPGAATGIAARLAPGPAAAASARLAPGGLGLGAIARLAEAASTLRFAPLPATDSLFSMVTLAASPGSEPAVQDVPVDVPPPLQLGTLVTAAVAGTAADVKARAQLGARVDLGDFVVAGDLAPAGSTVPGAPPRGSTALDDALVPALTELDATLVFPSVDALPDDSLLALAVDGAAVEALLVGANHELVRELQWRGAPVRPDATLLQQAWPQWAMPAVAEWAAGAALGAHAPQLAATVVLMRSALVASLPDLDPWLVQADAVPGGRRPGTTTLAPAFRGRLGEEIAYFGFVLSAAQIAGRDGGGGWYFCFQQAPQRPRFGLDETGVDTLRVWSDLDWSRVDATAGRLHLEPAPAVQDAGGLAWGRDGAQMAAILLQKPIRFAIHGSQLPGLGGA